MDITYVAQTDTCTFLLDAEGICVSCIPGPGADEETRTTAERCVGAQYVAAIDTGIEGLLAQDPAPGRALLFASVGKDNRVALVRSGPLVHITRLEEPEAAPETVRRVPRESALFPVEGGDDRRASAAELHRERGAEVPPPPSTRRAPETLRRYPPEVRPIIRRVSRG